MARSRSRSHRHQRRARSSRIWRSARLGTKFALVIATTMLLLPVTAGGVAVATILFARLPGNLPEQKPAYEALPSSVFDARGNLIGVFREFDLTVPITQQDVPQILKDAVVASEDRRFWTHRGVDVTGIGRAAWANYQSGGTVQGGSTITQQYVKNAYLSGERTVSRKLREAVLATQLERHMTKQEILFNYLNTVYFGSGTYGVGAAAASYFGKPTNQLTLSEAATLAGIIPAPTDYSPRVNPKVSEERREVVLAEMLDQGLISQTQFDEARPLEIWRVTDGPKPAKATPVLGPPPKGALAYPYFVNWIEQQLLARLGPAKLYRSGLRIETTIVPELQAKAEAAIKKSLAGTEAPLDMALVTVEPATGLVKAMVSGRDYNQSQVNLGTGGTLGFQPGSSFKAFVLAAALETGNINPETKYDAPGKYKVPNCDEGSEGCWVYNYDGGATNYGKMTLRAATAQSLNTVYAQLVLDSGIQHTAEVANRLGIKSIDPQASHGVSLALGAEEVSPLEMAGAYATFANLGVYQEPTGILRVLDKSGNILIDNSARVGNRALALGVATTVTDVLKGVVTGGTGVGAKLDKRPVAGKTGTAEDYRAAWFVGYTPQLSTAVWMGYVDASRSLRNINGVGAVTGGTIPTTAWADFMRSALEGTPIVEFPPPGPLPTPTKADFQPGATAAAADTEKPRQIDTQLRPPRANSVIDTPSDCGGPCQLYNRG